MFGNISPPRLEEDIALFVMTNLDAIPEERRAYFLLLRDFSGPQRQVEALERLLVGILEIEDFPEAAKPLLGEVADLVGRAGFYGKRERGLEIRNWLVSILDPIEGNDLPAPAALPEYTFVPAEPPPGLPGAPPVPE